MTENGIDSFALETNGQLFGADAKEELISLDSVEGNLTFVMFNQNLYRLSGCSKLRHSDSKASSDYINHKL